MLLDGIEFGEGKSSMDCSIMPTKLKGVYLVQTTDFFYPSIEDPYLQGKIGCANVLSDLYALGVYECDNMLMILAQSMEMDKADAIIVTRELIRGFNDQAKLAGTTVTGGQSVRNPWAIIGGVGTSVCIEKQMIRPENAMVGDVLVLTKALGTQVISNCNQWMYISEKWKKISDIISKDEVVRAMEIAIESMTRLNINAAKLMHKYEAHGATDVTGFGIWGHANNLAKAQLQNVRFVIHTLPIIRSMMKVDVHLNNTYNLLGGMSAETSGGILVAMSKENAFKFIAELKELDQQPAWIIGDVLENDKSENYALINTNPNVIEI